jgi:hypothetical protein
MTPLGLSICLHYHVSSDDFRDGDLSAPAVVDEINQLLVGGMLGKHAISPPFANKYYPTPRLRSFIGMLCDTPLPVQVWCHPDKAKDAGALGPTMIPPVEFVKC